MENKEIIGRRIRELRLKNGYEQMDIALKLGYKSDTTISKWESGASLPTGKKLPLLAMMLKTSTDYILFGEDSSTTSPEPQNELLTAINAKVVQLHPERQEVVLEVATEQLDEQEKEKVEKQTPTQITSIAEKRAEYEARNRVGKDVPGAVSAGTGVWQEYDNDMVVSFYEDDLPDDDDYDTIAIVVGHSMEPKIKNGDFLFIKLTDQVDLNRLGIFQVDGENYVKKLKEDRLESLNSDYPDIFPNEYSNFRTIGEVVDIYREG